MIGRRGLLGGVVAWWASGNARKPLGPQAREAERLDHRVMGTQRAGVGPAPTQDVIRARLVIISGTGITGIFDYNGTPAKGNLVAAMTPPGVTSDPFGNQIPSSGVFNAGTWNASGVLTSHFGINNSGDTFLVNAAGKTVVHERSSDGSEFFYNTSGEALGNLIGSITPATTTDGPGNTAQIGFSSYTSGVVANISNGAFFIGTPAQFAGTGGAGPGGIALQATGTARVEVSSGIENNTTDRAALMILYNAADNPAGANAEIAMTGSISMDSRATPGFGINPGLTAWCDVNGFLNARSSLAGDTNNYQMGEVILTTGGFTINSTTPQTILSMPVGIGTYVVEVWFVVANSTAADAAGWAFTGPSAGTQLVDFESKTSGTSTVSYGASATYTSTFNNQAAAGNQNVMMRALVAFTASGNLIITGKELVAANTITIFGGWMRVRHVS